MGKPSVNVIIGAYQKNESAYERVVLKGGVDIAQQLNKEGCIYDVRFIFDLKGKEVTVPADSILNFDGGSIENGSLVLDNTLLDGNVTFGSDLAISGTCKNQDAYQKWFENNDVDAWHRFINNVEGPANYSYENGVYNTTVSVIKSVDSSVNIDGNGAEVHFNELSAVGSSKYAMYLSPKDSDITDYYLAEGTVDGVEYTTTVDEGAVAVNLESVEGLHVHDKLCLQDTVRSSFSYERDYIQGEYLEVQNIVGNVVYFGSLVVGHYLHPAQFITYNGEKVFKDGVRLQKFHTFSGAVRDLTVYVEENELKSPNKNGINIVRGYGIKLDNVQSYGATYCCINLDNSQLVDITNCVGMPVPDDGTGNGIYGLVYTSCQSITIVGGKFNGYNHGLAGGAAYGHLGSGTPSSLSIVNRNIEIRGVIARSYRDTYAGINFHANTDNVRVIGNQISGFAGGGKRFIVKDNVIESRLSITPVVSFENTIEGNSIGGYIEVLSRNVRDSSSGAGCTGNWYQESGIEYLNVRNNVVKGYMKIQCYSGDDMDFTNTKNIVFNIEGNVVSGATALNMVIRPGSSSTIVKEESGDVRFINNILVGSGARIFGRNLTIRGNDIRNSNISVGYYNCLIEDNLVNNEDGSAFTHTITNEDTEKNSILHISKNVVLKGNLFSFGNNDFCVNQIKVDGNTMCAGTEDNYLIEVNRTPSDALIYATNNNILHGKQIKVNSGGTVYNSSNIVDGTVANGYITVSPLVSELRVDGGIYSSRPDLNKVEDGYDYYCTDTKRRIFASYSVVELSVTVYRDTEEEIKKEQVENTLLEGSKYRVTATRTDNVLRFKKSSNVETDMIVYDLDTTHYITAPDPEVYKVIEVQYPVTSTSTSARSVVNLYSAVWQEEDGAAPNVARKGSFEGKPASEDVYVGFKYFNTDTNEDIEYKGDDSWEVYDGATASSGGVRRRGTHSQRPSGADIYVGFWYFDTDLNKPICWNGTAWIGGDGDMSGLPSKGYSQYLVTSMFDASTIPLGFTFFAEDRNKPFYFGKPVDEQRIGNISTSTRYLSYATSNLTELHRYAFRTNRENIKVYYAANNTPSDNDVLIIDGIGYNNYAEFIAPDPTVYPYLIFVDPRTGTSIANVNISDIDLRWFEEDGVVGIYKDSGDVVHYTERKGAFASAPTVADNAIYVGFEYYDTTNKKPIYWNGTKWVDTNNFSPALSKGTTSNRPVGIHTESDVTSGSLATTDIGFAYYDTTLKKVIYAKAIDSTTGSVTWTDALGEVLE